MSRRDLLGSLFSFAKHDASDNSDDDSVIIAIPSNVLALALADDSDIPFSPPDAVMSLAVANMSLQFSLDNLLNSSDQAVARLGDLSSPDPVEFNPAADSLNASLVQDQQQVEQSIFNALEEANAASAKILQNSPVQQATYVGAGVKCKHSSSSDESGALTIVPVRNTSLTPAVTYVEDLTTDDGQTVKTLRDLFTKYYKHLIEEDHYLPNECNSLGELTDGAKKLKYTQEILEIVKIENDRLSSAEKINQVKSQLAKPYVQKALIKNHDEGLVLLKAVSCLFVIPGLLMAGYSKLRYGTFNFMQSAGRRTLEHAEKVVAVPAA